MNTKRTLTKSELATLYGVSICTLMKWLKKIKGLELTPFQKILTLKQLELIYQELGNPN
jgi:transcriptional regulator with XRE-family HTH domain